MRILNEQEKRDSLNDVLIELSKSQDILKEPKDRASFLYVLNQFIIIMKRKILGIITQIFFRH